MNRQCSAFVEELPSRVVRRAEKGVGSFVTIDVGGQHEEVFADGTTNSVSDLRIWVYLCDWQLLRSGKTLVTSEASEAEMSVAFVSLVGLNLESLAVGSSSGELEIQFSGEHKFTLRQNLIEYDEDDDLLIMYPHGAEPIGYRADWGFYRDSDKAGPVG